MFTGSSNDLALTHRWSRVRRASLAWAVALTVGIGGIAWVTPAAATTATATTASASAASERGASTPPPAASLQTGAWAYDGAIFLDPGSELYVAGLTNQAWPGQDGAPEPAGTSGDQASARRGTAAGAVAGTSSASTADPASAEPDPANPTSAAVTVDSFQFEVRTGSGDESSTVVTTQTLPAAYFEDPDGARIIDYAEWTIPAASFQDGTAFAVRVRAVNAAGTGDWSEFTRVHISTPPTPPTLSAPADEARVSGTRLNVSATLPGSFCGTGQAVLLDHYGNVMDSRDTPYGCGTDRVVTTVLNFPSWAEAGDYTWQMRANNSAAQSEWTSRALHYTTPPSLFYGVSHEIVDRRVYLTWQPPYLTGGLPIGPFSIPWTLGLTA